MLRPASTLLLLATTFVAGCDTTPSDIETVSFFRRRLGNQPLPPREVLVPAEGHRSFHAADQLEVLTFPSSPDIGRAVLADLRRTRRLLQSLFGRAPRPMSVALATGRPSDQSLNLAAYTTDPKWSRFPLGISSSRQLSAEDRTFVLRTMTHEWAESSLVWSLGLYEEDPANRWIGDGLAELAAVLAVQNSVGKEACRELLSQQVSALRKFEAAFGESLDVLSWRTRGGDPSESERDYGRYAGCLAIWLAWHEAGGAIQTARFCRRVASAPKSERQAASLLGWWRQLAKPARLATAVAVWTTGDAAAALNEFSRQLQNQPTTRRR